jgi:hypothetical protein
MRCGQAKWATTAGLPSVLNWVAMPDTATRKRTLAPWMGLLLTLLGVLSNWLPFIGFPAAPVPWISLLLSLIGFVVVLLGLWRAFGQSTVYKGKLSGSIAAAFSLLFLAGAIGFFWDARHIPAQPAAAPQIGQRVPDFTLPDSAGHSVSLRQLFSDAAGKEPPKALLLVFYRGYWWPYCNLELRGIEKSLAEFEAQGILPVAISVDAP